MRLANVIILVSDLAKSSAFYRDTLGLKEQGRVEGEFVFFDVGGATLAIRKAARPPAPGDTELSFEVQDINSTYESLRGRVVFAQPPRAVTGNEGGDLYATDFHDPDGHLLSITGWVPRPGSTAR